MKRRKEKEKAQQQTKTPRIEKAFLLWSGRKEELESWL
jgi:hypothetical protein